MKVISKQDIDIQIDREGTLSGRVVIDIWVSRKDDTSSEYHVQTKDWLIIDYGLETQQWKEIRSRDGAIQTKEYIYSYTTYDAQKDALEGMFPTILTGSAKDDYLLQSALLVSLSDVPIYNKIGTVGEHWERYII